MAKMGRPKTYRPHEIHLSVPKDEGKYRLKRLYWVLLSMEKKMKLDITAVNYREYSQVLTDFTDLSKALKLQGKVEYKYATKVDTRMDTRGSTESDTKGSGEKRVSQDGSADMGVGVRATNPIT